MYLPDTNIIIRALAGEKKEAKFLKMALGEANISISVIVIAEFVVKSDPTSLKIFNQLADHSSIVEVDREVAETAGYYRKKFLRKITRYFMLDCFLAAQAKIHNLILVTNNKSDFPMKDVKIIKP